MSINDASQTVSRVESVKGSEGIQHAFQQLTQDYQQYQAHHNSAETHQYWDQVTSKLRNDGVLPELAVAWAAENRENIGKNGEITKHSLDQVSHSADSGMLAQTMASELKNQYDTLRHTHHDGVMKLGVFPVEKNAITQGDINERLQQIDARTAHSDTPNPTVSTAAEALVKNHAELFAKAAAQHPGADKSYITKQDLVNLRNHDEQLTRFGQPGLLSQDERSAVDGMIQSWKTQAMKQAETHHFDSQTGTLAFSAITRDSLTHAAGFDSPKQMYEQYNSHPQQVHKIDTGAHPAPVESSSTSTRPPHAAAEGQHETEQVKTNEKNNTSGETIKGGEKAQAGDGYWHVAARLLGVDRQHATPEQNREIFKLTKELQQINHDKPLQPGDPVDIPQRFAQKGDANHTVTGEKKSGQNNTEVQQPVVNHQTPKTPLTAGAPHKEQHGESSQKQQVERPAPQVAEQPASEQTEHPAKSKNDQAGQRLTETQANHREQTAAQPKAQPKEQAGTRQENNASLENKRTTVDASSIPFTPEWQQREEKAYVNEAATVANSIAGKLAANPNDKAELETLQKAVDTSTSSSVDGVKESFINSFNKTMAEKHGQYHIDADGHIQRANGNGQNQEQATQQSKIEHSSQPADASTQRPVASTNPQFQQADSLIDDLKSNRQGADAVYNKVHGSFTEGYADSIRYQQYEDNQVHDQQQLAQVMKDAASKGTEQQLVDHINKQAAKSGYHVEQHTELGTNYYHLHNDKTGDDITLSQTGQSMLAGEARQKAADDAETQRQEAQAKAYREEQARPKPQNASQMAAELVKDGGKLPENHQDDLTNLIDKELRQHKSVDQIQQEVNAALKAQGSHLKIDLSVVEKNVDYPRDPSERYHNLSLSVTDTSTNQAVTSGQRLNVISVPIT